MKRILILSAVLFATCLTYAQQNNSEQSKTITIVSTKMQFKEMKEIFFCDPTEYPCWKWSVEAGYKNDWKSMNKWYAEQWNVNVVAQRAFSPYLFVGVGAGLAGGLHSDYRWKSIPVFARLTCNMLNRRFTPFAMLDAGWDVAVGQGKYRTNTIANKSGWLFNPAAGLALTMNGGARMYAAVGFAALQTQPTPEASDSLAPTYGYSVSMGFTF